MVILSHNSSVPSQDLREYSSRGRFGVWGGRRWAEVWGGTSKGSSQSIKKNRPKLFRFGEKSTWWWN